eukprot:COSAG01_NODE_26039_length_725_cov_1.113419_1_plen_23_part_10
MKYQGEGWGLTGETGGTASRSGV